MASLELSAIVKRFDAVRAVDGASLEARPGEIHAVVGENGAGKSTLLKIAAGLLVPDAGRVRVDGKFLEPHTPREALARGVAMVQQHFALVPVLTALENVVLGAEPTKGFGRLDLGRARKRVEELSRELGAEIPLDARVEELGVGDRQRIEIVRALYRDAAIVILDEPTSVLAPQEAEALYRSLRRLAGQGRTLVVVTHKLDEVRAHADAVTALRRGKVVLRDARTLGRPIDTGALADAIMGEGAPPAPERRARRLGEAVLTVRELTFGTALRGANLLVRAHEIVGVAGVEGNGQRELVRVLSGLDRPAGGAVTIAGGEAAVVHEDRQGEGLVLDATVTDNLVLGELGRLSRWGLLDGARITEEAQGRAERGGVRPLRLDLPARALSGGNQQKIVTVRAVSRQRPLLVLAHPTRGVDVGAARLIHAQILEAAQKGAAVLVLSADLAELRALADRIFVLYRGRFVASFDPSAADAEIGAAMLGELAAGASA